MNKFKNKVVYDSESGEVRDTRKFMSMLEDYWLPRRDGNRGTEITTLPGGQQLGETGDLDYMKDLLYKSLNVPFSRLQPESTFNLGRASEITRDEVKFTKFIIRLRKKFSTLFLRLLERQLLLKNICKQSEWEEWKNAIFFEFAVDNFFSEIKELEIGRERITQVREIDEYVGKYFSHSYIRHRILNQSDEEIERIDKEIDDEKKDPKYADLDMDEFGAETEPSPPPKEPSPPPAPPKEDEEPKEDDKEQNEELSKKQIELIESMTRFINE